MLFNLSQSRRSQAVESAVQLAREAGIGLCDVVGSDAELHAVDAGSLPQSSVHDTLLIFLTRSLWCCSDTETRKTLFYVHNKRYQSKLLDERANRALSFLVGLTKQIFVRV